MSHKKLLVRGVFFSYAALVAQIGYSFLSVPLALSHLSTAEFGMWGLIATIGSFLMLAELGMTESFMRYLFECKEGKDPERYGRLFTASFLGLGLVALIILACGSIVALFSAPLFGIPLAMRQEFTWVMLGGSVTTAIVMATKMTGVALVLHHRQDLAQIAQIGLFAIRLLVIFLAFRAGWGIYSLLAVEVAGILWLVPFNAVMCRRNGYFPQAGTLALPSRTEWLEIRNYSLTAFLVKVGGSVVAGLPQILISTCVGLSAAGLWTVYTRVFGILRDIAVRPVGVISPTLIDYFVRGEVSRSVRRWGHVSQFAMAVAGLVFAVAAANNARFVQLWTGVDSGWGLLINVSIALYFLSFVAAGCPYAVISFSKRFGIAWVIPIFQGLVVAGTAYYFAEPLGELGIILTASAGFLGGMLLFGMRQLGRVTGHSAWHIFFPAIARPFLVAPLIFLCAWGIERQTASVPGYLGLFLSSGLSCGIGFALMSFLGVSADVRRDLFSLLLKPFRRFRSVRPGLATGVDPENDVRVDQ